MTVVAAIAREGRVVMAADTCTAYHGTEVTGVRKIERVRVGDDEALLSCSGSASLLAVAVRHWSSEAPDPTDDRAVREWANVSATALTEIAAAQDPPILTTHGDSSQAIDGAFVLGWHGRLFYLCTHVAFEPEDGLAALGIGADLAFGAMAVGLDVQWPHEATVQRAVRLACARYEGCRVGPSGPVVEHLGA